MFQAIKGAHFILLCVLIAWEDLGEVSAHVIWKEDKYSLLQEPGEIPAQ